MTRMADGDERPRCAAPGCGRRLRATDMRCRCERTFCSAHRLPEHHGCDFDYRKSLEGAADAMRCVATKLR